jgi:hypothetical protein
VSVSRIRRLLSTQPVLVGDTADIVTVAAGVLGMWLPEDVAAKVALGLSALVWYLLSTWFKWSKVTPVARADQAEKDAYAAGHAVGHQSGAAEAILEPLAPPPPPPPATLGAAAEARRRLQAAQLAPVSGPPADERPVPRATGLLAGVDLPPEAFQRGAS